jgi:hypothetical protein
MPRVAAPILQSVLADPDNDIARKVYASALKASTKPTDLARSEFILLQLELASPEREKNDPEWEAKFDQTHHLLEQFQTDWDASAHRRKKRSWWPIHHQYGWWAYDRGFIDGGMITAIDLQEIQENLFQRAPVRRLVVTRASHYLNPLSKLESLERVRSLHLVGDADTDEDLALLTERARACGFDVLEYHLPRLFPEGEEFFDALRNGQRSYLEEHASWTLASEAARKRLFELATSPRFRRLRHQHQIGFAGEWLAQTEWVYLGKELRAAGAWAVAKSHSDLAELGLCRRLALVRPGHREQLEKLPYFIGEAT